VTGRILVVDDDRQMVRTLRDILRLKGWEADGAHTGEEALIAIETGAYHAVLMDIRMPGINGVEAFHAMRARRPALRVILMTAYTARELVAEAERAGAIQVLSKPVALPQLIPLLEDLRNQSRSVLLVDDDPGYLKTLSDALGSKGYDIAQARTLDAALDHLTRECPPIVLLDLRLDGHEPRDSIIAIRELSPSVVLILYTGHPVAMDEAIQGVPSAWVHASLHKPFAVNDLVDLLHDLLPAD
jgi:DNA-binding NtrC family response regulator